MSDSDAARPSSFWIWLVTCSLFLAIIAGGALLATYLFFPAVADAEPWLPLAGMALVCLPWLFWLITFVYNVVSRLFRSPASAAAASSSRGKGGASPAGNAAAEGKEIADPAGQDSAAVGAGRHVRFGCAVVVDDGQVTPAAPGDSGNQESSTASGESETPLALWMAP